MLLTMLTFDIVAANAAAGTLTAGIASLPKQAVGFVNYLERQLQKQGLSLGDDRKVLVGVENYDLQTRGKAAILARAALWRPWVAKGDIETPLLPELKANFTLHLAIKSEDENASSIDELEQALPSLLVKFAGGSIFPSQTPRYTKKMVSFGSIDDLNGWLVSRPRAQFVADSAVSLIDERIDDDHDQLDTFLRLLSVHRVSDEKGHSYWERQHAQGWLIPLEIGYAGTHEPVVNRPAARDSQTPCVVAIPLLSLGQCVSGRRLASAKYQGYRIWWQPRTNLNTRHFYLKSFS